MGRETTDVQLICMPYAGVERPNLALGILKASLIRQGLRAKVCYANLAYAGYIGLPNYAYLSNNYVKWLMGEWTFAGAAFPDFEPDPGPYLKICEQLQVRGPFLQNIRARVPAFVEAIAHQVLETEPKIVGCSSAFQQHCASLAVLRRIKALRPEVVTVLGGSNCEGPMGRVTHQCFDWLDYVISGEAELFFPQLCQALIEGRDLAPADLPEGVYGPALRKDGASWPAPARMMIHDLDATPIPNFDDYFSALKASPLAMQITPGLVFETSRGCWWGEKNQCTFCGLIGGERTFRAKSPTHVLGELAELRNTYRIGKLMATDTILDLKYFKTFLPELARQHDKYILFFEASAHLTKEQIKLLADAGVRWIQVGIESLHNQLLTLLNKGTRAWHNVQTLKWAMEYGIFVNWNFLGDFPGEDPEWYREMLVWLPLISHLQPPLSLWLIRYDRFSPFHQHPDRYHLDLQPAAVYSQIYPMTPEQLADLAYYFEDVTTRSEAVAQAKVSVLTALSNHIQDWQRQFFEQRKDIIKQQVSRARPKLSMRQENGRLFITDTRPCAIQKDLILDGLAANVYLACDSAVTAAQMTQSLNGKPGGKLTWEEIQPVVADLLAQKILLQLDDRFISLAISEPLAEIMPFEDNPLGLAILPRVKEPASEA